MTADSTVPKWRNVRVLNCSVVFNGYTQLSFSVSDDWEPGPERQASGDQASLAIQNMGLPEALQLWLRDLFYESIITSVSVQGTENGWTVLVASVLRSYGETILNSLLTAAGMPPNNENTTRAALKKIREANPRFNEADALAHWLAQCLHKAVERIFAVSTT